MKKKLLTLSAVVAVGILSFSCNKGISDERHPNMPRGGGKCNALNPSCSNRIESVNKMDNVSGEKTPAKKLTMNSVETFKGVIKNVKRERYPDKKVFVQIILETKEGDKMILVGPASYVDQSKVKLLVGDKVTVKGYRVSANGEEMIMAKEIDKNGNVLKLLNDQRTPLWSNGQSRY